MPRISAESRGAAAFRAGKRAPRPPKHMSADAQAIWVEIAASKPVDWFDSGAQVLLEQYCELAVQARGVSRRLERLRAAEAWDEMKSWEKRAALLSVTLYGLATKLRLSVQALVERHSRKIVERGSAEAADNLIGGAAVWDEGGEAKSLN